MYKTMYNGILHISSTEIVSSPLIKTLCLKCYVCIWVRECFVAVLSNRIIIGQPWWRGVGVEKKVGGGGEGAETEKGRKGGRGNREVKEGNEGK